MEASGDSPFLYGDSEEGDTEGIARKANSSSRIYLIIVIYDIVDNRRRYRINKALEGYGTRVQRSAFECHLDNAGFQKMLEDIVGYLDEEKDSLRVYKLTSTIEVRAWGITGLTENIGFAVL